MEGLLGFVIRHSGLSPTTDLEWVAYKGRYAAMDLLMAADGCSFASPPDLCLEEMSEPGR